VKFPRATRQMVVRIAGKRMYLWRAVGHEGEVLDMLVQRRRDTQAALRLMRKLLKNRASHRSCWAPTGWGPTARLSGNCGSRALTIEASERTIAPKTSTKSCGDESAKCSGSSQLDPRSGSSACTLPYTTPSIINDISSLDRRFGSSEPKQPTGGKTRLP
jgi:DDE superfamily endonuclease